MEDTDNANNSQPTKIISPTINKTNNNIFKSLFFLSLIILILVIVTAFLLIKKNQQQADDITQQANDITPIIETKKETPDINQTLLTIQKYIKIRSTINNFSKSLYYDWVVDNNEKKVPLIGQTFNLGDFLDKGYVDIANTYSTKEIRDIANDFFIFFDFKKDINNSWTSSTSSYEEHLGYTKGDLKCSVNIVYDNASYSDFYCGIIDETQLKLRKKFSLILNPGEDENFVFSVDNIDPFVTPDNKITNDYVAFGRFYDSSTQNNQRDELGTWMATNIDDKWQFIWDSKKNIDCSTKEKYNFFKKPYGYYTLDCK
jgi:hypothetical protein